jgi:tRNA 2-thiocytidine biosynthesis protein TtcA
LAHISKALLRTIGRTNARYQLIREGDRILVGLSGGKDSLTLLHALKHMQRHAPFAFTFKAVTISYGMGEDFTHLIEHCQDEGIDHAVIKTTIMELAKEKIRKNSSFCSFFSRMRRGALYTEAHTHGYNTLALGHHLDDAAESFFMNLFYNGAMRSMAPLYKASNGIRVIRPLIFVRERQLIDCAKQNHWKTIGDEACPAMHFDVRMPWARAEMKQFLAHLEKEKKDLFTSMRAAFQNIHDETFFDENRFACD